ncbi:hypothetical protein FHY55_12145 [Oceanicola sp. D3]|uniref:hypothetical protein n=1 Tax=Oceanicola sp. D3 TaxID=2587163 RepID=UPI0011200828|nr:hypothetical protein [Oceanicola sp. D3]QDC09946.1 hypothetical protein FHY55_12145 [Oceanicola sp. D3]
MFGTIFGQRATSTPRIETRREAIDRLLTDLNTAIDFLPEKPVVKVHPGTGHIELELPEVEEDRTRHLA